MDQAKPIFVKQIGGHVFYKYPYADISVATNPHTAIHDLWSIWKVMIIDDRTAADILQLLVDRCRKTGLQLLLNIESRDTLPEAHRLAVAVLSSDEKDGIFYTPSSVVAYSDQKLRQLFGL